MATVLAEQLKLGVELAPALVVLGTVAGRWAGNTSVGKVLLKDPVDNDPDGEHGGHDQHDVDAEHGFARDGDESTPLLNGGGASKHRVKVHTWPFVIIGLAGLMLHVTLNLQSGYTHHLALVASSVFVWTYAALRRPKIISYSVFYIYTLATLSAGLSLYLLSSHWHLLVLVHSLLGLGLCLALPLNASRTGQAPEERATFGSWLFFTFSSPLIARGTKGPLEDGDPEIGAQMVPTEMETKRVKRLFDQMGYDSAWIFTAR